MSAASSMSLGFGVADDLNTLIAKCPTTAKQQWMSTVIEVHSQVCCDCAHELYPVL